jgi:AraC-like DNA-binding protein
MGTTVRAGATAGLLEYVAARGGAPARVLARADVALAELADSERMLPVARVVALFDAAAQELGDEDFGFHFGQQRDASVLGVLAFAILHAPTVGAALRNLDRYSGFQMRRGHMRFGRVGAIATITFEISLPDYEACRHYTEATATMGLRVMQILCGREWHPQRMRFGHRAPAQLGERQRFYRSPMLFGQGVHMQTAFSAADLELRVPAADPDLLRVVERHLDAHLGSDERGVWIEEVRQAMADALSIGDPSVRALGRRLGLSPRTLQRRLGEHQASFQRLLADVRGELADQNLGRNDLSLGEVAFLLGYNDLSSFHRAFRRWNGRTPLEHRRTLAGAAARGA